MFSLFKFFKLAKFPKKVSLKGIEQGQIKTKEVRIMEFSEDRKVILRKIIKENNDKVGCLIHLKSTKTWTIEGCTKYRELYKGYSIDDYYDYLDRVGNFLKEAGYPVFILVESYKIERIRKWLKKKIKPQRWIILVPAYLTDPTPYLDGWFRFSTPKLKYERRYEEWKRVLGNLGIKEIILGGETAQGVKADGEGNIIEGGKRCIGEAFEALKGQFRVKAAKDLFSPPQILWNNPQKGSNSGPIGRINE